MGCIVIAMSDRDNARRLTEIIKSFGLNQDIVTCLRESSLIALTKNRSVSLVICQSRLGNKSIEEILSEISEDVKFLLLSKRAAGSDFGGRLTRLGVPFRKSELCSSIEEILGKSELIRSPKKRKVRSPEEQKVIDQAKEKLGSELGMTEPDAHRYIQKISMDRGLSFAQTARVIMANDL